MKSADRSLGLIVVTLTINLAPFIMFLWFIHDYRPLLKPVVKAAGKHAGLSLWTIFENFIRKLYGENKPWFVIGTILCYTLRIENMCGSFIKIGNQVENQRMTKQTCSTPKVFVIAYMFFWPAIIGLFLEKKNSACCLLKTNPEFSHQITLFSFSSATLFLEGSQLNLSRFDLSKISLFPKWKNRLNNDWFKDHLRGKDAFWGWTPCLFPSKTCC